ncbi:MAG: DUF748 domain-containing protein [Flavobacteriales bacterium]|nr:MAG: DUF748 domain-containing protein [Flavobacteriales bacterium]
MRRLRRVLFILVPALTVLLLLLAFLAPYLLKRYIEAHSEEWIDRKVTIGNLILNPFTGTFAINELTCTEPRSDARFVAWRKASVKWDLWALWDKNHWRFHTIELVEPYVHVAQRGARFNFSDLLELSGDAPPDPSDTVPTRFDLEDMRVTDGEVVYDSDVLKAPVSALGLNVLCNRITSESARMDFDLDFRLNTGGNVDGEFTIDTEKALYGIDALFKGIDLSGALPYLQDLMDCKAMAGKLDLDLDLQDSWADTSALALRAALGINGLEITDPASERLAAIGSAQVRLDTLTARDHRFELRAMRIDSAFARYEMFKDSTDNWSRLMRAASTTGTATADSGSVATASTSNVFVLLAEYISTLAKEFIANEYTADSISFNHGSVAFMDHTLAQPFRYSIDNLSLLSTRVNTADSMAQLACSAQLNGTGTLTGALRIDPKTFKDFTAQATVQQLVLRDLDAYMQWYAAHPVEDGVLGYSGTTSVHNGHIDSGNAISIDRMKLGKKVDEHAEDITVLPLRLGVSLLKDRNGIIELDLPVSGDINDPEFKPWPIVWKVLKNLVLKAVSAPVNLVARAVDGVDPAELEVVRFEPLQTTLGKTQLNALDNLAKVLQAKPELKVALVPVIDERTSADAVALFRAKALMLFGERALTAADSSSVEALSEEDSSFVRFMDERSPSTVGRAAAERSAAIIGADAVQQQVTSMEQLRARHVAQYLIAARLPPERANIRTGTGQEVGTYKGKPGYRFVYDAAD